MKPQKAIYRSMPAFSAKGKKNVILCCLMHGHTTNPVLVIQDHLNGLLSLQGCLRRRIRSRSKIPSGSLTPTMGTTLGATSVGERGPVTSTLRQLVRLCVCLRENPTGRIFTLHIR